MDGAQRLFLGLPVPPAAKAALADTVTALTGGPPLPGRPESPDKWHLTLVFLGAVAPEAREALVAALAAAPLGAPFTLAVGAAGAFPRRSRARVLWLGFGEGQDAVIRLQGRVAAVTAAQGFAPEARPYAPHLTLARLPVPADVRPLLARPLPPGPAWTVDRVVLYWSRPAARGTTYEEVASAALL